MELLFPAPNDFDHFHSHSNKSLCVHTNGVLEGTRLRSAPFSCARIAEVAALFHDLGKLNPNFQLKINPNFQFDGEVAMREYSRHAYLSAYAFLAYCVSNRIESLGLRQADVWRVLALIAHHHGHLPNFLNLLAEKECDDTLAFIASQPPLPLSKYLQQWWKHQEFDILDAKFQKYFKAERFRTLDLSVGKLRTDYVPHRLDYFLETQFAFASLIEADKRDAGDNKYFHREKQLEWARENFAPSLNAKFDMLASHTAGELNRVRTQIREEATRNLREKLQSGTRTFSLTAPTGAGKTYTLLALAAAIREVAPQHAVIYGLPFLTITEQVESVCHDLFGQNPDFVSRFDSRTYNEKLDLLLAQLDGNPQQENGDNLRALMQEAFSADTFDAAFTITTFVQIFETLLSNRNSTLLKLPNFSQTIFLLDEIQSLPPRLYVFFAAYLQAFCERFDCYAIFSTATMPVFQISDDNQRARELFHGYSAEKVQELLPRKYFDKEIFNRYRIQTLQREPMTREGLAEGVVEQNSSALIVLNTIADSRALFELLEETADAEVILLNTHFTLRDRQKKIVRCKKLLEEKQNVILVSTQLIEAGVDIDFPMTFRDLCPLPSLIQTAGRCNRNGEHERGIVWFFELKDEQRSRAEYIYDNEPQWFLNFVREEILIQDGFSENELFDLQQKYFHKVSRDLKLGECILRLDNDLQTANLVEQIDLLAFETVGSFRLIDEEHGEVLRYFVPQEEDDCESRFETLLDLIQRYLVERRAAGGKLSYGIARYFSIEIESQLRCMAPDIVQFRVPHGKQPPASAGECCGVHLLAVGGDYSDRTGISFDGDGTAIF